MSFVSHPALASLAFAIFCSTLQIAIGAFIGLHQRRFDSQIPPPDGPRAVLRAQLGGTQRAPSWTSWLRAAAAAFVLVAITYFVAYVWMSRPAARPVAVAVPDPILTPGATVLLARADVCRASNTKNKPVPAALQRKVFDEYGIHRAEPSAYEVDYLITPALGGADDIHNLWPQSYTATVWNAQVKDALEDHLRDLVCDGELDLATAQRAIASNWIEAYKKYFHTNQPLRRLR